MSENKQEVLPQEQPVEQVAEQPMVRARAQGNLDVLAPTEKSLRIALFDEAFQQQMIGQVAGWMQPEVFASLFLESALSMLDGLKPEAKEAVLKNKLMLLKAAARVASLRAVPGKAAQEVSLIFRNGYRKNDGTMVPPQIDVMPEWRYMLRQMAESDEVLRIEPVRLVHVTDVFEFRQHQVVEHSYDPFDSRRVFKHPELVKSDDPELHGLKGGYLRVHLKSGGVIDHMVPFAKIDANRRASKNPGGADPWGRWYVEQVSKTIVRDAYSKRIVQMSIASLTAMDEAIALDDEALGNSAERGGYQGVTVDGEVVQVPRLKGNAALRALAGK